MKIPEKSSQLISDALISKSLLEKSEVKASAAIQDLVQNIKTKILS